MYALLSTIDLALRIYIYILFANVIFSWLCTFNVINMHNQLVRMVGRFLYQATEPVFYPVRLILPDLRPLDIAPVIVFLVIYFIRSFMWTQFFSL